MFTTISLLSIVKICALSTTLIIDKSTASALSEQMIIDKLVIIPIISDKTIYSFYSKKPIYRKEVKYLKPFVDSLTLCH